MEHRDTAIDKLEARRKELIAEMGQIETMLDKPLSKDWEDRSSERQGDEVLEALGVHDLDELRQIDAALARAASGTYGICARCGEEIGAERLRVLPEAALCRDCAAGS